MLKFFYRLKKRGGVVLFAVIAFMTLLITMATVAYFSARASFNTVVSNYDFSQMYISTTSVSDMIISALAEDTSKAGEDATKGLNYFTGLKSKVEKMITDTGGDPTKAGATLVGISNNIAYADKDNTSKILVNGANNAVEPGVIDAVKTTIKLENIVVNSPSSGINTYYFSITTIGYYRNNTITVQDSIYAEAGVPSKKSSPLFSTFFTATGQQLKNGAVSHTTRAVVIDTYQISDNAYFQNDFTFITGANEDCAFMGSVRTTGGLYIQKIQNYSIAPPKKDGTGKITERHDWIIGGDMYIGSEVSSLDLNGNDLIVHGDLYIQHGGACVTAGNIYVEGNIYCLNGDVTFTIKNGTERLNKDSDNKPIANGVFVNGSIIKVSDSKTQKTGSGTWAEGKDTLAAKAGVDKSALTIEDEFKALNQIMKDVINNPWASGFMESKCQGNTPTIKDGTLYINSGSINNSNIPSTSAKAFNWSDLKLQIDTQQENATEYYDQVEETTLTKLLDSTNDDGGMKRIEYDNYSADTAYANELVLDFSKVESKVSIGDPITIGTTKTGSGTATITYMDTDNPWNSKNVVITLPYVKNGYVLKYNGEIPYMGGGGGNVTFKILTPNGPQLDEHDEPIYMTETVEKDGKQVTQIAVDKTGKKITVPESMPIVLAANFDESPDDKDAMKDENSKNAFRWTASQSSNSGCIFVELVDKDDPTKSASGNIVFEMGTYNKAGKYVPYDTKNANDTEAVTYYAKEKEIVGTLNQVNAFSITNGEALGKELQPSSPQTSVQYTFLESGTNDIQSKYDNKIILVSNKNGLYKGTPKIAFTSPGGDSTFCGYVYAPNGQYNVNQDKSTMPLFGGMIVSDYYIKKGKYLYGEPDPALIAALGTTLKNKSNNNITPGPTVNETKWYTNIGKNYLG